MPELPEVETVRRGLDEVVVGRTIDAVEVHHPRAVRRHLAGAADFSAALAGQVITATRRRGKYLWLPLESGDALLAHLGMSGQLLVCPALTPYETHLRVRLSLGPDPRTAVAGAEPIDVRFVDQRTFGGVWLSTGGAHLPSEIAHIAPDPLEPAFDDVVFMAAVRRRKTGLKRALLDQTLISGVGNIYADEALWRARLHYARPTETTTRIELGRVLDAVRAVFVDALGAGGTSFDALYVNVNGQSGYFDRSLAVYGQADRPCPRCGTAIRREAFMNRSSYLCPRCQPRPRRARW